MALTSGAYTLSNAMRSMIGRMSWGLADQAVSSMTNFAVGVVVARMLGVVEFGAFSLAWVTYSVLLNLSRGLATDPLTVRHSGPPDARWRTAVGQATGTATLVGVAVGAPTAIIGMAIPGPVGEAFLALGIVMPALLLQDSWRYAFFAAAQGKWAFLNDVVWAVALVPAIAVAGHDGSVFTIVLAWGVSAGLAAGVGCLQTRIRPRLGTIAAWVKQHGDLNLRYMIENVSVGVAAQLRMYGLGAIAGLAAVGAVRGGQLLLGPFLAVLMGMSLVSVVEAARVRRRAPHRLSRFCLSLGLAQACACALWGLGLLFVLPDAAGYALLGDVWPAAAALIVPTTFNVMAGSMGDGAAAGLRALGASRNSLRAQLVTAVAYGACGVIGAALDGARGSAWGVALGTAIGAACAWQQLRVALRRSAATADQIPTVDIEESRNP
jgi:O-antigen/teichoic acid export membrane protein